MAQSATQGGVSSGCSSCAPVLVGEPARREVRQCRQGPVEVALAGEDGAGAGGANPWVMTMSEASTASRFGCSALRSMSISRIASTTAGGPHEESTLSVCRRDEVGDSEPDGKQTEQPPKRPLR
jgi:hypothetical protein